MNALKVMEELKANPELKFPQVKKYCEDSGTFGVIKKCAGDKRFNEIVNHVINDKLTKQQVKDKFFNGKGHAAGRICSIAAQLKTCELIKVRLPKTKIEKLEKKRVRESFKHASMSPLYRSFGLVKEPSILRGAHLKAAQEYALDLLKAGGAKEPELISLANHVTEFRGRQ